MGSNGYFKKGGKTLAFTIVEPFTDYVTDDQIMISELKRIGMDVSFDGVSSNAWTADLESGSFEASLDWSGLGVTPYYLYDSILDYGISAPLGKTASGDYERWDNGATQAFLTEYKDSTNQTQRFQAILGLEGIMVKDLPVVPAFYAANWGEWRTDKFVGWPTPKDPYAPISPDDPQSSEVVVLHLRPAP
jgi:peptide/nickel transport system substrate-binding protein